jgi:hypothetical protein
MTSLASDVLFLDIVLSSLPPPQCPLTPHCIHSEFSFVLFYVYCLVHLHEYLCDISARREDRLFQFGIRLLPPDQK